MPGCSARCLCVPCPCSAPCTPLWASPALSARSRASGLPAPTLDALTVPAPSAALTASAFPNCISLQFARLLAAVTSGSSHAQPVPGMRQHFLQCFCGVGRVTLADCAIALKVVQHRSDLPDSASKVVHLWCGGEKIASFLQNTQYFVLIIAEFGYFLGDSWRIRDEIQALDKYRRVLCGRSGGRG